MKKMPENGLTELDRLSYVIHSIERQCQIVPIGSYKKNTLGEVCVNDAFKGLKFDDLTDLNQYMHLRPIEQQLKRELAEREQDIFTHDFLDNAALETPACSWTVQKDAVNPQLVTIRSRFWPGYYAYARASSSIFGGIYIGDGIKNLDMPFMI
jgi:radial spoke head protein 9